MLKFSRLFQAEQCTGNPVRHADWPPFSLLYFRLLDFRDRNYARSGLLLQLNTRYRSS
jgi:hypothetical protein